MQNSLRRQRFQACPEALDAVVQQQLFSCNGMHEAFAPPFQEA